jgi:hypothetical protein
VDHFKLERSFFEDFLNTLIGQGIGQLVAGVS